MDVREKRAVEAIMTMLESPVRAWHCSAAELLGRLVVNPDNEPFLLPFVSQVIYKPSISLFTISVCLSSDLHNDSYHVP